MNEDKKLNDLKHEQKSWSVDYYWVGRDQMQTSQLLLAVVWILMSRRFEHNERHFCSESLFGMASQIFSMQVWIGKNFLKHTVWNSDLKRMKHGCFRHKPPCIYAMKIYFVVENT